MWSGWKIGMDGHSETWDGLLARPGGLRARPTLALLCLLLAFTALADDSALVTAAKANKEKKKSTRKVITNADVKKSTGKLITLQPSNVGPVPPAPSKSPLELQAEQRQQQAQSDELRAAAEKRVSDLKGELARIEQSYYDEDDPLVRDTVIAKKFAETKKKLLAAQNELPPSP